MENAYNPNLNIGDTPHAISTRPSNLEISQFDKSQENSHVSNLTSKNSTNHLTNQPDLNLMPTVANTEPKSYAEGLPYKNLPGASNPETSRNRDLHPNSLLVQNTPKKSTNHPANHTQPSYIPMEGAYNPNLNIGDTPHAISTRPSNLEISQSAKSQENSHASNLTPTTTNNQPTTHPNSILMSIEASNDPILPVEGPLNKNSPGPSNTRNRDPPTHTTTHTTRRLQSIHPELAQYTQDILPPAHEFITTKPEETFTEVTPGNNKPKANPTQQKQRQTNQDSSFSDKSKSSVSWADDDAMDIDEPDTPTHQLQHTTPTTPPSSL